MKKIFSLLVVSLVFLALCTVSFSDEEESKYRKDFTVNNSTKLEIPKSTSGEIKFNLKGNYIIEIIGDGSNIAMNDAISVFRGKKETFIGPKNISENYYKFKVKFMTNRIYKIFYRTTTQKANLTIKIRRIK